MERTPRFRDASGKEHARHFKQEVDAQRWLDEMTAATVTGQYVDPSAGRVDLPRVRRTVASHAGAQANHRNPRRDHAAPPRLPRARRQSARLCAAQRHPVLVKQLSLELAPATVGVVHRILAGILKAAVRDRRIVTSPCEGTKLLKVHRQRIEPMALEAVEALTEAIPERYKALVTFAAGTGLRQGEALGLTVDRIDFLRRHLTVDRQLVTMPDRASVHRATWPTDEFVFTTELGDPIRRTAFSAAVGRPAVRRAGLSGVTMHSLRHFYASLLIRHRESVKTAQARLGHASAAETLDTYSRLWPDSDDRTRAAVDAVLGRVADSLRTDAAR